ncbi:MAG: hypothetical protein ABL958_12670 [Bdellovibrionia bacterium]
MKLMKIAAAAIAIFTAFSAQAQLRPGTAPRTIVECRVKKGMHQTFSVYITVPGLNPIYSASVVQTAHFGRNVLINGLRVQRVDNPAKSYVQFTAKNFNLIVRTSRNQGLQAGTLTAINSDGRRIEESKLACVTN